MSNTDASSNRSDTIFFSLLGLAIVAAFIAALTLHKAKNEVRSERVRAWQEMVDRAPTQQHSEVMSYLASQVPGCFVNSSKDPARLGMKFSFVPSQYKQNYRAQVIAHEKECLKNLRGQALVSTDEGRRLIAEVSVPE